MKALTLIMFAVAPIFAGCVTTRSDLRAQNAKLEAEIKETEEKLETAREQRDEAKSKLWTARITISLQDHSRILTLWAERDPVAESAFGQIWADQRSEDSKRFQGRVLLIGEDYEVTCRELIIEDGEIQINGLYALHHVGDEDQIIADQIIAKGDRTSVRLKAPGLWEVEGPADYVF